MKSIRSCEVVSNLKKDTEPLFDLENLETILEEKKNCLEEYAYIIHDQDAYTESEEKRNPEHKAGTLKQPHIHLLLKFKRNQPQKLEYVAKWFNLKENFINKINGRWEDACLYLTHQNAPDKFLYPIEDVKASFDYEQFVEDEANKPDINTILERILNGEIREYNKTLEIDNMMLVTYARRIKEAFNVRSEYLQATIKERNMECIFITGGSNLGKTTLAKRIAQEKGLDFFVSSGSNDPLDSYAQQPCILLDEIRPSSLGLSDLLKMLDPFTASSTKSRYRNKFINCQLIILTTILDIDTFYNHVFTDSEEPITQLKRRCKTLVNVTKELIFLSVWDDKLLKYTPPVAYKNDLLDQFVLKEKTVEDVKEKASQLFPFLQPAGPELSGFEPLADDEQIEF